MSEPQVNSQRLWRDAEAISQWPREAGSEGEVAAFDYIAYQLAQHGISAAQRRIPALISLPGCADMVLDGQLVPVITHSMAASTGPDGVEAPLVLAAAAESAWQDRIVVFDGLAVPSAVQRAQQAGALAALFLSFDRIAHEMIVSNVWGSPAPHEQGLLPHIPVATAGGEAATAVREHVAGSQTTPIARLRTEVSTGWLEIPLLVADVKAPHACEEQFVLFSGHVDSWHLGAMDNAGANATMLEIARLAHDHREQMRRHLRIAFWSGHSHGRYAGSAWYVDEHWTDLDRHCVAHVNIDSIGACGATVLSHAPSMADTHDVGAQAVQAVAGQDLQRERFTRAGDQSLMNIGVSSLFLTLSEQPCGGESRLRDGSALLKGRSAADTGGLGWWWHTPEDTIDKLDSAILVRDAEIYRHAIAAFTDEAIVPLDIASSAGQLGDQLEEIAARCGARFDLNRMLEQSAHVLRLATAAMRRVKELREKPEHPDVMQVNRALVAASRPLTRLGYAAEDRFGHDRAAASCPIPLLAPLDALLATTPSSDAEYMQRTLAVRRANRALDELRLAADALEEIVG
jgi:hypothetical protein